MTQVISLLNLQVGGGKTTTTLNLASALKRRGYNVLAVDLAPEETLQHRVRLSNPSRYSRQLTNTKIISTLEGWHLMPAATTISLLHARAMYRLAQDRMFRDELRFLFDAYDYVLIDCSNHERALTVEALTLTDEVIVPLDSESLQFHDAVDRLGQLFAARMEINPQLRFGGVFLARYAPHFRRAREMLTTLFDTLGPVNCFSAYLCDSSEIRQAEQRHMSVIADAPTSQAAHTFYQLAEQLTAAGVPRMMQTPSLAVLPGRTFLEPTPQFQVAAATAEVPDPIPTWHTRATNSSDPNQALRYAVLALLEEPNNAAILELFETRLVEYLTHARFPDVENVIELGDFLAEHSFDHYAAQAFRRATEFDPFSARAWTGLARVTHSDEERAFAMRKFLSFDVGMTAAEAPASPRRPRSQNEQRLYAPLSPRLQPASG